MLKYLGNNDWYYITNAQMYYIASGDLSYYVFAISEGLKELFQTKTIGKAVEKINNMEEN